MNDNNYTVLAKVLPLVILLTFIYEAWRWEVKDIVWTILKIWKAGAV